MGSDWYFDGERVYDVPRHNVDFDGGKFTPEQLLEVIKNLLDTGYITSIKFATALLTHFTEFISHVWRENMYDYYMKYLDSGDECKYFFKLFTDDEKNEKDFVDEFIKWDGKDICDKDICYLYEYFYICVLENGKLSKDDISMEKIRRIAHDTLIKQSTEFEEYLTKHGVSKTVEIYYD
jgi:hypothetical protein